MTREQQVESRPEAPREAPPLTVPFVDLKAQYRRIREEVHRALDAVMEKAAFVLGDAVRDFEAAFAARHGVKHCVAVSSGTSALHAALVAMGIGPGDEVVVPANTFIATAEAVSHCGATPRFADVGEDDYCLDPASLESAITARTKAVIPVHLYGQPAEMDEIVRVAERHGLEILEDCSQAHDAEYRGRKVGTFGRAAAFSFYPSKNLGAYGEAGAVLTNDPALAEKVRMLRDHGGRKKYHHEFVGYNYRMDGFQGAVLGVKLRYLAEWTERRRRAAARYRELLDGLPVRLPREKPHVRHVYHLFVIRVAERDRVAAALNDKGIATGVHYPIPLHLSEAYRELGYREGDFPVAEAASKEILSLPIYPELTDEQMDYVAKCLKEAL